MKIEVDDLCRARGGLGGGVFDALSEGAKELVRADTRRMLADLARQVDEHGYKPVHHTSRYADVNSILIASRPTAPVPDAARRMANDVLDVAASLTRIARRGLGEDV